MTSAVALVHGWGGSPDATWPLDGLPAALDDAGFSVTRPELPGHHAIASSHDPAAYRDIHDDLERRLPPGLIDAVGYSLGAKLLLRIAVGDPHRFRRLVLVGLGVNVHAREAGDVVDLALRGGPGVEVAPALAQVVQAARASGNDLASMSAVIRRPSEPLTVDDLADVDCPVLLVAGELDLIGGRAAVLAAELPDARLLTLFGADHVSLPTDPRVAAAVVDFLTG